jgi:hypothetical protein
MFHVENRYKTIFTAAARRVESTTALHRLLPDPPCAF